MKAESDSRFKMRFRLVTGFGFVASTFFFSFQNFESVDLKKAAETASQEVTAQVPPPAKPAVTPER